MDIDRWGWVRLFNSQNLGEKVLELDNHQIYTEKSVFKYRIEDERIVFDKVFEHEHDVRSLVVVNEFIFAAYYKSGEVMVFERAENEFFLLDTFTIWSDSPSEHLYRSMEHMVSMVSDHKEKIFVIVDKLECFIERQIYTQQTSRIQLAARPMTHTFYKNKLILSLTNGMLNFYDKD